VWLTRFAELMMWLGAILVPVGGVFLAHFVVMRERVNVERVYQRDTLPAFSIAGMTAWALGFVVYKLAAPIGATLPALAASVAAYVVLSSLHRRRLAARAAGVVLIAALLPACGVRSHTERQTAVQGPAIVSGVVSMGNVMFEVVTWEVAAGERLPSEFKGIAFEPAGVLDQTMDRLTRYGVAHQKPDRVMMPNAAGTPTVAYVNVGLDGPSGLPPAMGSIFINDNLGNARAAERRREGALELERRQGGALGVIAVRELVIGVEDLPSALAQWRRLQGGDRRGTDPILEWAIGPAMRFVSAPTGAILEMTVQVRSLARAREFLQREDLLLTEGDAVFVRPSAVEGLRIRLVQ
jgi:hypothetical protein